MDFRVVYIAYGNEAILAQAAVSLLSIARVEGTWPPPFPVVMHTDRPDYFAAFAPHLQVEPMPASDMEHWISAAGGYRNVAKCHLLARQQGSFIFLDSDTIVVRSLARLAAKLQPGKAFFQTREYRLGAHSACGKLIAAGLPGLGADAAMFNSGLLAVHAADVAALSEAPALATRLRCEFRIGPAEQLADATVLSRRARIKVAPSWVVHYWQEKVVFRRFVQGLATTRSWAAWLEELHSGNDPFRALGWRLRPSLFAASMKWLEWRERFGG